MMSPAWSPDARRLAYVSFEGGASAVYVQTLRTGTRERVSARAGVNGAPALSPDGRMLALTLSREARQPRHLHAGSLDASAAPAHDRCRHRHRADLVARRPQHLFHVRSRRRSADLPRRHGAGRTRATRDVRRHLQRAAARCRRTASSSPSCTARTAPIASASSTRRTASCRC